MGLASSGVCRILCVLGFSVSSVNEMIKFWTLSHMACPMFAATFSVILTKEQIC